MKRISLTLIVIFAGISLCMMACRPDTPIWRKKDARAWVDTVMAQVVDDHTVHLRAAFQLGKEADREAAGFQISQTENFESDIREIEADVIQDTLRALDTMLSEKTRYYVRAYLRTRTGIYFSPNAIDFETPEYILPGTIAELKCSTALHLGTIVAGSAGTGISKVAYTGGNGGRYNALSVPSTGVSGLTLKLDAGTFADGNDTLVFSISGTAATSGIASFVLSIGGQSCTLNRTVSAISAAGLITGLVCFNPVNSGTLVHSVTVSGVSSVISYTGGNGLAHEGQVVSSTGVTGLMATLNAGVFSSGNGTILYTISGTPSVIGDAFFAISIGGQNCTLIRIVKALWRPDIIHCATPTQVVPIINPTTNKTWMDRNLGASRAAISATDAAAYGDLYQWGRFGDGHQCRNSGTTMTLSTSDTPDNANFILNTVSPNDWRSPQNINLWQGENGANNPCPAGYRLPSELEWEAERVSWNSNSSAGAFASPLKLPLGGYRSQINGLLYLMGSGGNYWSTSISGTSAGNLTFATGSATMTFNSRGNGFSVRCIQD